MSEKEKKNLFYTELFKKCSSKDKDSGDFEECCKEEASKSKIDEITKLAILNPPESAVERVKKIGERLINKKLDNIERNLDKNT